MMEPLLRATAKAEARHFWFRGFRAFVTPLVRLAISHTPGTSARILDCGCGTGANVELLEQFGRAYGFDLSGVGLQIAHQAGRTRVARANVASAPFPSESFDLVTSFDVLYSLPEREEHAAVSEMYRLLKPGAFALVNVAAMNVLTGDHSVLSRELRRYTRASLEDLLRAGGFTIVRLTYTNASLFLPMVMSRAFQRWRGLAAEQEVQTRHEITVPAAPMNAILTALLLLESVWLRRFDEPFGSSLLCLARKPPESRT